MYRLSNWSISRFLLLLSLLMSCLSWLPAAAQIDTSLQSPPIVSALDSGILLRDAAASDDDVAQMGTIGTPNRRGFGSTAWASTVNSPDVLVSGQITGVVTASGSGLPLSGAHAWLYLPNGLLVSNAQTDGQGVYQLTNVLSGTYKVRFEGVGVGAGYGAKWYNGQAGLNSATPILVAENATVANINAALTVGGHITGTLTAADSGLPLQDVRVRAIDADGIATDMFLSPQMTTDAAGHYDLVGITSGSYRVRFSPTSGASKLYLLSYYHGRPTRDSADQVSVTAPGVTANVNDVLQRGGLISGHVTGADNGLPVSGTQVNFYNCFGYPAFGSVGAFTDINGAYTTTRGLASGPYRVLFTPPIIPSHDYLPQAYNHQLDLIAANQVNVTAPGVSTGVDAVLDIGGMITGTVTVSGTGQPLQGVIVTATTSSGAFVRAAYTNADGEYRLLRLPSGVYRVTSIIATRQYYNDRTDLESADPITVTAPNAVSNINFKSHGPGYLTGFVHDPSGNFLSGVRVLAYNGDGHLVESITTGDPNYFYDYNYEFNDLPPGTYRLLFVPPSARTGYFLDAFNYGYQYYSNQLDFSAANSVVVTENI